jgi:hypothetical protein
MSYIPAIIAGAFVGCFALSLLFALGKAAANGDRLLNRRDNRVKTKTPEEAGSPRATLTLPQLLAVGRALKRV